MTNGPTRPTSALSRRSALGGVGAAAAALSLGTLKPVAAQDDKAAMAKHPIVGAWFEEFDPAHPGALLDVTAFHADEPSRRAIP